jgi:hypothetical protein
MNQRGLCSSRGLPFTLAMIKWIRYLAGVNYLVRPATTILAGWGGGNFLMVRVSWLSFP